MNKVEMQKNLNNEKFLKFVREFRDWLEAEFGDGKDGSGKVAIEKAPSLQPISIQWLEESGHMHYTLDNGICEWMSKDWPEIPKDDYSPRGPLYGKVENLLVCAPGGAIIINKTMSEEEAVELAEAEWASIFDGDEEAVPLKWLAYTTCFDDERWFRYSGLSVADQQKYMAVAVKALKVMNHSQVLQDILSGELKVSVDIRHYPDRGLTTITAIE